MGMELEWKFRAEPAQQAAVLTAYGPWHSIQMETTYYDTPDRALSARRVTLRRRLENGVSICTVKTPADGGARGEWECRCGCVEDSIGILCGLGAPAWLSGLTASGLEPVCSAAFVRQACTVTVKDSSAEIAVDRGFLMGGGRELPLCEIEVELKSGEPDAVAQFAFALADRFALRPEKRSKFHRARMLAEGGSCDEIG